MNDFFGPLWNTLPEPLRLQLEGYATGFWAILPQLILSVLFLLFVWAVIRAVRWLLPRTLRRARMRRALIDVIMMLITVGLWLFGVLIAVTIAFPTITPGKALTALGVGGVAIGFAFKDVFENFLAGVLLLIREPFSIDDYIDCEDIEGQVEEITIRDTHVRQTDGQLVVAPNAMFFKNPVTIRTARDVRRTTIICGVAYGEDVDKAREIIAKAVRGVDAVRDDVRDVEIFAQEFADSAINFEVTWWTGSRPIDIRSSRDKVVAAVKRALDDAGVEIPFPYRTMTFAEPLTLRHEDDSGQQPAG
ncbi:mechanosensitive ion channel family protein [Sulfitobacter mediterraneus]|uniref:mechanosensitive ion channel family protein n=1 Tax=Sulfitobacter mediterraneus TaxID=83219 RepID=UPI0019339EB9|nr:mechanosensitive ion channel family protein [Sulfitobacter mediterraneus]MBM1309491.1 mechanosensitive ion channel family protein [Sulfitobacter mediterraneus]MBM1313376.1 mechanosensitive ion channel family protein [Sulfitobacter mediterraneus]MBM1321760.1 mechanosensitive ion channel family protein [Sulfitobacter mediterraneus]MBM1325647.1 mechanosensitive ion channel family protein [Sulfitobacter mediterraneus]MBM1396993.1 mechanosensitive ion channel family protein [Sulfitobacter medite